MSKGDFDWAVNEVQQDLGKEWAQDNFGHTLLHMALYENGELSPDLQHSAYNAFVGYEDDNGIHVPGYMESEYGYDFEDMFDWDAYREWYDSQ